MATSGFDRLVTSRARRRKPPPGADIPRSDYNSPGVQHLAQESQRIAGARQNIVNENRYEAQRQSRKLGRYGRPKSRYT